MTKDSILNTVKEAIGISEEDDHFDNILIMYINGVIAALRQNNVGPQTGFSITGSGERWTDYIDDLSTREELKTYLCNKVRLEFDPPTSSVLLGALQSVISEFEWRTIHDE